MREQLTRSQWNKILHTLNTLDIPPSNIREQYSGRGMYGATCIGIEANSFHSVTAFMLAVTDQLRHIALSDVDAESGPSSAQRDLLLAMSHDMVVDDMGLGKIYYFPGWTVTE